MEFLNSIVLGNAIGTWLAALGVAIGIFCALLMIRRVIFRSLRAFADKTRTNLDDLVVELIGGTKHFVLMLFSIYLASMILIRSPRPEKYIEIALVAALIVQCGFWGNRIITFVIEKYLRKRRDDGTENKSVPALLGFIGHVILWSLVLLLTLDNLGINITTLLAGLGIGGIAVALAIQNILGDLFASFSILLDRPFEIGDYILVDDFQGSVEHIGIKSTRIRSLSGEQNIFSNSDLLKSRIRNYKRMEERRVVFTLGVTYQTPLRTVSDIPPMLKDIVVRQEGTRFDRAHFKEYGDSALIFEIVYYVLSRDYNRYMDIQQQINLEVYRQFEQSKIDFAFPTRTLLIASNQSTMTGVSPGDGIKQDAD